MGNHSGLLIDGLSVHYGKTRVLEKVSLKIPPSSIVGLAGRNGIGKTSLLRAISGVVKREGSVYFNGVLLPALPDVVARAGVIHVPEGRGMIAGMSVRENLMLGSLAVGRSDGVAAIEEVTGIFPVLRDLLSRKAGFLSGGQQQVVAIARGLAARPYVLMVDELSLGLAPKAAHDTLHMLVDEVRRRRISLVIVDQNVRMLMNVCDTMYFLDQGRMHSWSGAKGDEGWQRFFLGG